MYSTPFILFFNWGFGREEGAFLRMEAEDFGFWILGVEFWTEGG
jgi:hypothetical protein